MCSGVGAAVDEFGDAVDCGSGDAYDGGEEESVEAEDVLVARGPQGEGYEQGGADADGDGSRHASGNAKRAMKIGLAATQHDERDELQDQRRAVEDEVDGDEALEGRSVARDPRSPRTPAR